MVRKGEKGVPRSPETRIKIGIGSRNTRLSEKRPCSYGCGRILNSGNMATHIKSEHEFICRIPECPSTKHKGLGFCIPHHRLHKICLTFGTTLLSVYDLYLSQEKKCSICDMECLFSGTGEGHSGRMKTIAIDHHHNSMTFRGLLCTSCNLGIGQLGEDIGRLERAIKYIKEHNDKH